MNNQQNDYVEIDLLQIMKLLWRNAWIIVLCMALVGGGALAYAVFGVTPMYESTAMMYVNNTAVKLDSTSVSIGSGELTAAKQLLDTYLVILKSRTTLEEVIEAADLDYTYEQLDKMVSSSAVNDTQVFEIKVTTSDPKESKLIADTIISVLPEKISDIVYGSSVKIVARAVEATSKSSPSYSKYALIGAMLGAVLSCGTVVVIDLFDTTVRSEDYLKQKYSDIPVIALIPDVLESGGKRAYDKKYNRYSAGNEVRE